LVYVSIQQLAHVILALLRVDMCVESTHKSIDMCVESTHKSNDTPV